MPKQPSKNGLGQNSGFSLKRSWQKTKKKLWPRSVWKRLLVATLAVFLFFNLIMFSVGQWYIQKHKNEPLVVGTTFISDYAEKFDLDPKQTLEAIFSDLGIKRVRLVSYWKEIEATPGTYDFSELDWQFAMANEYGAKVSLAIGMRQPRWPECHEPKWVHELSKEQWQPKLYGYMEAVVDRYKTNPALLEYQLENEFFMEVFGECTDFERERLVEEFNLVKKWDPNHRVLISRSNNWIGLPLGEPTPDIFGISVYKRVWDTTITKRYFEYPLPAWFYSALAGGGEIFTGKAMLIHEMQAEPWTPNGLEIIETPVDEQFKSMNAERMKSRIEYAEATGMRTIDLWGAEWWYWLKEQKGNASVWNTVKAALVEAEAENSQL